MRLSQINLKRFSLVGKVCWNFKSSIQPWILSVLSPRFFLTSFSTCATSPLLLQVGFFPCDCVELINEKIPPSVQNSVPKPGTARCALARGEFSKTCSPGSESESVLTWLPCVCFPAHSVCKKHGKLVTFLRSFMKSRPPPQKLRQRGILRERVFGCDLGEHLHNSGHDGRISHTL